MDIKHIKVGEWYNVPFKVVEIKSGDIHMENGGIKAVCQPSELSEITSVERTERLWNGMCDVLFDNNGQKYDPCREFRKGDKVKAVLRHGRIPNDGVPKDVILEVIADERDGIVKVLHKMGVILEIFNVYALYLELVTPVEEQEPYYVKNIIRGYAVYERGAGDLSASCVFWSKYHPHAKEAAEAERDRLNAEYRKEHA